MVHNVEAPSILQQLRQETREAHEKVEQNRFNESLSAGVVSVEAYIWFLQKLYGFIKPYEAHLHRFSFPPELEISKRQRADLIVADLSVLASGHLPPLPVCADMPPLQSYEQIVGCMYVIEGSTLGGQVITRQLDKAGVHIHTYLTGYGDKTGKMWKAFCHFLTQASLTADQSAIVASAVTTFDILNDWMNKP